MSLAEFGVTIGFSGVAAGLAVYLVGCWLVRKDLYAEARRLAFLSLALVLGGGALMVGCVLSIDPPEQPVNCAAAFAECQEAAVAEETR